MQENEYQIIIIQCCQNCQSHQSYTRHFEWKYFQQFNQLKRKIQRFIPNTIVIKNPVPDELIKQSEIKLQQNLYINKNSNQTVTFPRIGAFQIYIFNVLIFSKLKIHSWPNHYKILQTLNQIILAKRNNQPLDQFSLHNELIVDEEIKNDDKKDKIFSSLQTSPMKKHRILSKKKRFIQSSSNNHTITKASHILNKYSPYEIRQKSMTMIIDNKQKQKDNIKIINNDNRRLQPLIDFQQTKKKLSKQTKSNNYEQLQKLQERYNSNINNYDRTNEQLRLPILKGNHNNNNGSFYQHKRNSRSRIFNSLSHIDEYSEQPISYIENKGSILDNYQNKKYPNVIKNVLSSSESNMNNESESLIYGINNNNNKVKQSSEAVEEANGKRRENQLYQNNKNYPVDDKFNLSYDDNNIEDNQLENMRFVENVAVQYNDEVYKGTLQNKYMQYEINQQALADFGMQLDEKDFPKDVQVNMVQTEHVQILDPEEEARKALLKPVFEDSAIQTNIVIKKRQKQIQIQTTIPLFTQQQINTDIKQYTNRGYQFPDEDYQKKKLSKIEISSEFRNLYEKRRGLNIDNLQRYYSVDRFQQKSTQQKWLGKAKDNQSIDDIRKKLFIETMLFSAYNFFGIKTPEKRLALLKCTNVISDKIVFPHLYHTLTQELSNVRYLFQFEEFSLQNKKYPLSQELTLKTNNSRIKFNNWGKFLAIMYFLQDSSIFQTYSNDGSISFSSNPMNLFSNIALQIQNDEVKQIYRMAGQHYLLHPTHMSSNLQKQFIYLDNQSKNYIDVNRLSKFIEKQFISMLNRIIMTKTIDQLKLFIREIFINKSKSYDVKYQKTLQSIDLDGASEEWELKKKEESSHVNNIEYREKSVSMRFIEDKYKEKKQQVRLLVESFLSKLDQRVEFIQKVFQGKLYTYNKFSSLQAQVSYSLLPSLTIQRKFSFKDQTQLTKKDIIKYLRTYNNFTILSGECGNGKSFLLDELRRQLSQSSRNNLIEIKKVELVNVNEMRKFVQENVKELVKNVIFVEEIGYKEIEKLALIVKDIMNVGQVMDMKTEIAYLIVLKSQQLYQPLTLRIAGMLGRSFMKQQKFASLKILLLQNDEIKEYMHRAIKLEENQKSITMKERFIEKIMKGIDRMLCLRNLFYLRLFCDNVEYEMEKGEIDDDVSVKNVTKYSILRRNLQICEDKHFNELKNMNIKHKKVFDELRNLVLKLFILPHSSTQYKNIPQKQLYQKLDNKRTHLIKTFFSQYQEQLLIKNQLQFYPLDLKYLIKRKNQKIILNQKDKNAVQIFLKQNIELFHHQEFYNYLLVEAFIYYIQKGYRNLNVSVLLSNPNLLTMLKEKYSLSKSYSSLLKIVYQSLSFPSLSEQASNSITLLSKLGYVFTNLNFDNCAIPFADLSSSTFYNCSFKNTNMNSVLMYRTQFLNCNFDGAMMEEVSLLVKKYDVEFTPLCCTISPDGRTVALGCGNYLILLSVETGKQIKKLQAHLDVIRSVSYSKDGKSIITIADDKTIRTWDTFSYKEVVFKLLQKGSVYYNSQSQMIAAINNENTLKVWDTKSMANQSFCSGHADIITCVSFSQYGKYILTGSKDSTLRLWNYEGKELHLYKSHQKQIICGKVSPNNAIILSSSKSKQLILFHLESQAVINKKLFQNEISQICPDLKEKYIIAIFAQGNQISVLNYQNLEIEHKLKGHTNRVISVNFDSCYQKLVSLSKDRTVRVWDVKKIMKIEEKLNQQNEKILKKGSIKSISFNQTNKTYTTGHQNGDILIWDDQTHDVLEQLKDHQGAVNKVLFGQRTNKLYSAGKDGILRIWDFLTSRSPKKIQISSAQIIELKINQTSNLIVLSTVNNELVIYDIQGTKLIYSTREEGMINAMAFSENDKYLAVGGNEKYAITYKIQLQNVENTIQRFEQLGEHPQPITHLVFQGDSSLISALKNGNIYIWNFLKGSLMKKIENNIPITSLNIMSEKYLCFSSEQGKIRFINMDQAKQVKVFRYKDSCVTLQIINKNDQNPSFMYAIYKDGNIIKWNLNQLNNNNNGIGKSNSNIKNFPSSSSLLLIDNSQIQSNIMLLNNGTNLNKKIKFGRKAVNLDGSLIVEIEGAKSIKLKNLFNYTEEIIDIRDCPDTIQGVGFDQSIANESKILISSVIKPVNNNLADTKSIILLLKNGVYWSVDEGRQCKNMKFQQDQEGDLLYIKYNFGVFYRSVVKKIKNLRKPNQKIIDEIVIG